MLLSISHLAYALISFMDNEEFAQFPSSEMVNSATLGHFCEPLYTIRDKLVIVFNAMDFVFKASQLLRRIILRQWLCVWAVVRRSSFPAFGNRISPHPTKTSEVVQLKEGCR
jgi:hypothetical protein